MTKLLLKTIDLNAPTQLRKRKESQLHVEDLAFAYADNGEYKEMPVVGLIKGSDVLVPIDGFHRLRAIEWLASDDFKKMDDTPDVSHIDLETVDVEVVRFDTIGEAIIAAAGVNATHGMKRQVGDVATAIAAIIEVEKMQFMLTNYTLNKHAIMKAVNCSASSYDRESKEQRRNLVKQRNFDIRAMSAEGKSQRNIAACVGCDQATVWKVLGDGKTSVTQIHQSEEPELEGDGKTSVTQIHQSEDGEPTSVFTHATSVTPVENPWEDTETPAAVNTSTNAVAIIEVPATPETSSSIISMFNTLGQAEKDELLLILSDLAETF